MNSAIFRTATESYQVSHIVYAGSVGEIPEERRKSDNTHSFKITTTASPVFCYYRNEDAAKNARGKLGAMLNTVKPHVFKHGYEIIDTRSVVAISTVFALRNPQGDLTHTFYVTLETRDPDKNKVWLKYKSEENAKKGRNALFASIHSLHENAPVTEEKSEAVEAFTQC